MIMRKSLSVLLAVLLITSGMMFVHADGITANLVYVEDFESFSVGTYSGADLVDLGGPLQAVNIGSGCSLRVCQEEDGNKYLEATVPAYCAFGLYFGIGANRKYGYMTFDYKYPTSEGNAYFATYAHDGFSTAASGVSYLNGSAKWNIDVSGASTVNTVTEWTEAKGKNYTNAQSPCIGIGRVQASSTSNVIHIDNIIVWEFNDTVGNTHNSKVASAVTFANSTGNEGDVTMPSPHNGIAWCNLYSAQSGYSTKPTVNLNLYEPTGAPTGKEFVGWSLTDGGNKIKDTMYGTFKIPGAITLYAVWVDAGETEPPTPIVMKEDFESFTVGQELSSSDLAFIELNNFGYSPFTATVMNENGNKYLRISTTRYGGIRLKNRATEAGSEYWTLTYRNPIAEQTSKFQVYAGSSHTGSSQGGGFTLSTEWRNSTQGANPSKPAFGAFFDSRDANGNYVVDIDDMYYWWVPEGITEEITTTFENSTVNAPSNPVLPSAATNSIWTSPAPEEVSNSIYLPDVVPTDPTGQYQFIGWSRSDNGKIISDVESTYKCILNETLYAVWTEALTYTVSGTTVSVSGKINLIPVETAPTVYLAYYKVSGGNKKLIGVKSFAATAGQIDDVGTKTITLDAVPDVIEAFVWNSNITALTRVQTVSPEL